MPIEFPQYLRDDPFRRVEWKAYAKLPVQIAPNRERLGVLFDKNSLAPGIGTRTEPNVLALGKNYALDSAIVPPAKTMYAPPAMRNIAEARRLGFTRLILSGVSRDAIGVALGNCQVMVFSTTGKNLVAETTSDASGNWSVDVSFGGPFFFVEYKVGAPDVFGTSPNTNVATVA